MRIVIVLLLLLSTFSVLAAQARGTLRVESATSEPRVAWRRSGLLPVREVLTGLI